MLNDVFHEYNLSMGRKVSNSPYPFLFLFFSIFLPFLAWFLHLYPQRPVGGCLYICLLSRRAVLMTQKQVVPMSLADVYSLPLTPFYGGYASLK